MSKASKNNNGTGFSSGYSFDEELLLEEEIKEPPMFKVLLHNDDYTSMEFVVGILIDIFKKNPEEANKIMIEIHRKGIGVCGVYTSEIAETKAMVVRNKAKLAGYPLLCTMEEA